MTKVVGTVVVNKPGFSIQMCCKRKLVVPRALGHMGLQFREIMMAEEIPIFPNMHRNMECSHDLALKLNAKQEVFLRVLVYNIWKGGLECMLINRMIQSLDIIGLNLQ